MDIHIWVRVPDGATVMGDNVWNTLRSTRDPLHTAELELRFLIINFLWAETPLGVVKHAEVFAGLLNCDDVHETSGKVDVRASFGVDLDKPLHEDEHRLTSCECVLQPLTKEHNQGKAL